MLTCTKHLRLGLLLLVALAAQAQQPEGKLLAGRFWTDTPNAVKIGYMLGLHEYLGSIHPADGKKYFPPALTMGEMVAAMDQFYKEPENMPIPLLFSQVAVTLKANGASDAEVSKLVSALRKAVQQQ